MEFNTTVDVRAEARADGYNAPGDGPAWSDYADPDLDELREAADELRAGLQEEATATFPNSIYIENAAREVELIAQALEHLTRGVPVRVAQDDDGYWFAYPSLCSETK